MKLILAILFLLSPLCLKADPGWGERGNGNIDDFVSPCDTTKHSHGNSGIKTDNPESLDDPGKPGFELGKECEGPDAPYDDPANDQH